MSKKRKLEPSPRPRDKKRKHVRTRDLPRRRSIAGTKKRTGPTSKNRSLSRDLAVKGETGLRLDFPAKLTPTTCEFLPGTTYQDDSQSLLKIAQVRSASNWWIGAMCNQMEAKHGETYAQAATETGLPPETLSILKYVESRVPPENRFEPPLTWSHSRVVAKFPPEEQKEWLGKAIEKEWSVRDLSEAIKAGNPKADKKDAEENDSDEAGERAGCEICGDSSAGMRCCGKCSSVAAAALENGGIKEAIRLLKAKPSKPQIEMLKWAFNYIETPDPMPELWEDRYVALKRIVEKAA